MKGNISDFKGVWTLAEQRNGEISSPSYELLAWGKGLADKLNVELASVVLGYNVKDKVQELIYRGANKVYVIDNPLLEHFTSDVYAKVIANMVKKYKPEIFIASATTFGRTIMPILAAQIETGLTADCTELDIEEDSRFLIQTRPAIGGNIMATIKTPEHRPQMSTVRPRSKRPLARDNSRKGEIIHETVADNLLKSKIKFLKFIKDESSESPLQEADIVVSGGKGLKDPKNFKMIYKLANVLNGTVGASRQAVDMGWIPYSHQVGLSGKTVSPRLYVAIGISGAVQHLAGMSSAETIIAVNKDPDANIFKVSDFGIVGDLFDIVPILTNKIKTKEKG